MLAALYGDRSRADHGRRCGRPSRASCARCAARRRGASAGAPRRRSPTTNVSCARRSWSRSAISATTPARSPRRARRARAWLAAPSAEGTDLARIAVPLAAKRGDAALFDRLLGVVKQPADARDPRAGAGWAGQLRRPGADRTDARRWCSTARIKTQDLRYLFPSIGLRPAARDVVHAWIERHFDELARLFPSFIAWRARARRARAVRRGPRARRRGVPAPARRQAGRASRRTCASRSRRACAAPRSPAPRGPTPRAGSRRRL